MSEIKDKQPALHRSTSYTDSMHQQNDSLHQSHPQLVTSKEKEPRQQRSQSLTQTVAGSLVETVAEEIIQNPIQFRQKKAVVISMNPSDRDDADKLRNMLTSDYSKPPVAPRSIASQPDHKTVEIVQELGSENATLVRAVVSSQSRRRHHKQEKLTTHQQIETVLFEELKRKVMRALLVQEQGSSTQIYPLSVFIKAQNSLLCRDLVSLFIMGANSLYLFIYNWKEEPVLVSTSGGAGVYQHHEEILKWIHTIGSAASTVIHPSPAVSAMVVMTNFEELVNKSAGEHRTAKKFGDASTHKLCEQLGVHSCASILDSKTIFLKHGREREGHSCESDELMRKLADSNFPTRDVDPRWVHLLTKICGKNHHPVLQMESYLELAKSEKLEEEEAFKALSFFKEAKLVFFLPHTKKCELRAIIFTDMEWLVNTLIGLLTPPAFNDMGCLWRDWKCLQETGIMSEAIKSNIEQRATSIIKVKLPSQWVFTLLHEVSLFTHIHPNKFFCPLYLCDKQDSKGEADHEAYFDCTIPPLYLRPNSGCVTDQYTMRLFCYIISSGILSLQECQSRTHAIFLYREHNLRFTISCNMDCLKIEVESSFSGRALDDKYASDIAQELVRSIVRASEEMGETWYPVLLTSDIDTGKPCTKHPNQFFQCCDGHCSHFHKRPLHLSKVVYSPDDPHLECELSRQCCAISDTELFWVKRSLQVKCT